MSQSHSKGIRRERELVSMFDEADCASTRVPNSGGGTKRNLPDVIAGVGSSIVVVEAKASKGDRIYIGSHEIESLVDFAQSFGATPWIGVRFDQEDWYFFRPGNLYTTDSGKYRIKREVTQEQGRTFSQLVNSVHEFADAR